MKKEEEQSLKARGEGDKTYVPMPHDLWVLRCHLFPLSMHTHHVVIILRSPQLCKFIGLSNQI